MGGMGLLSALGLSLSPPRLAHRPPLPLRTARRDFVLREACASYFNTVTSAADGGRARGGWLGLVHDARTFYSLRVIFQCRQALLLPNSLRVEDVRSRRLIVCS